MTIEPKSILAYCSPQRVISGLVFIPLLAYCFAPFQDMHLPYSLRLVFWTGVMALALTVTWFARKIVRDWLRDFGSIARDASFALVIFSLFAPSLWVLSWVVFTIGGQVSPGFLSVTPYVIMFATGLMLVRQREHPLQNDNIRATPRLCNRLPDGFDGEIYRLSVRDHYVDVVTSEGIFTIRSRLTDAIDDMEPVMGNCTHRSHWVVADAIAGVERQDGKIWLRLCNDDLVPVSRKYKPDLEQAGWI